MSRVTKFTKKPADVEDFDIDFAEYLEYHNDLAASVTVTAPAGITVDSHELSGSVVKVWVSGGIARRTYTVSAILTTQGGRVKQGDIRIRVKP